jgi:hypothetical protein
VFWIKKRAGKEIRRSHKQILYIPFIDGWSLGNALLEVFPIRPAVLPFQGAGTERHGLKGRKSANWRKYLSGVGIGAERK